MMKYLFACMIAVALTVAGTASASQAPAPLEITPVVQSSAPMLVGNKKRTNIFQRLLELERRKNAWLKRTFLGA